MAFFSRPLMIAVFPLAGVLAEISLSAAPIDDFSTPQSAAVDATNDAVFSSTVEAGPIGGTVVPAGGQREIGVSKTNNAIGAAEAEVFPGAALYDALGAVMGRLFVEYSGLGGVDLSGFDKLTISGLIDTSAASGTGTTLGVTLEDNLANSANSSFMLNVPGEFLQEIPLINFAAVDVANVTRITLGTFDDAGTFVDVPAGGDITLLRFEVANEAVQSVPEPSSFWTWGAMGAATVVFLFWSFHRRRVRCNAV